MALRPPGVTSILQSVEKRGETDREPSFLKHLLLAPLIAVGALVLALAVALTYMPRFTSDPDLALETADQAVFVVFGLLIAVFFLALLAAIVLFLIGLYKLIDRRNEHLARDRLLRNGLVAYCRRLAEESESERAGDHVETMERIHNEALLEENERPAAVHLVLTILPVPFWIYYVVYFLLKDLPRHARRQARFVREARTVFEHLGHHPDDIPPIRPIQERSFLVSALLMVFLGPIGILVVFYWLFEDPPDHFARQWAHEDALVELVGEGDAPAPDEAPEPGPDAGPGAPMPPPGIGDEELSTGSAELDEPPGTEPLEGSREAEPPEPDEPSLDTGSAEEAEPAPEPEFTIWGCDECGTEFKVPPQRPVRVTCKECGHSEVLEE